MSRSSPLQPLCEELGRPLSTPESVFGLLQAWDRNFPVLQAAIDELQREGEQPAGVVESIGLDAVKTHAPAHLEAMGCTTTASSVRAMCWRELSPDWAPNATHAVRKMLE